MGRRTTSLPSKYIIAKYWDKQDNFKTSNDMLWNPMTDVGEPSCQACGCWNEAWDIGEFDNREDKVIYFGIDTKKTIRQKEAYNNSILKHNEDILKQRWEKTGFERCHIIADKFGGSCSPKNLLLMCKACHVAFDQEVDISDIKDIQKVYDWCKNRGGNKVSIVTEYIQAYVKEYNMEEKKFVNYFANCWMQMPIGEAKKLEKHIEKVCANAKILYDMSIKEFAI